MPTPPVLPQVAAVAVEPAEAAPALVKAALLLTHMLLRIRCA